jgi:hypothetical protein
MGGGWAESRQFFDAGPSMIKVIWGEKKHLCVSIVLKLTGRAQKSARFTGLHRNLNSNQNRSGLIALIRLRIGEA